MRSAEEILLKHVEIMMEKSGHNFYPIEDLKKEPEWDITLMAIEEARNEAIMEAVEIAFPTCDRYEPYMSEFGEGRKEIILELIKRA